MIAEYVIKIGLSVWVGWWMFGAIIALIGKAGD